MLCLVHVLVREVGENTRRLASPFYDWMTKMPLLMPMMMRYICTHHQTPPKFSKIGPFAVQIFDVPGT